MLNTKYLIEIASDETKVNGVIPYRLEDKIKFTQQDINTCKLNFKLDGYTEGFAGAPTLVVNGKKI